jgi:hypothetical protein
MMTLKSNELPQIKMHFCSAEDNFSVPEVIRHLIFEVTSVELIKKPYSEFLIEKPFLDQSQASSAAPF